MRISDRELRLPTATIGRFLKIAEESKDIISLGPGEPDFTAPEYVLKSAIKALTEKNTHYSPAGGRTELKEKILKKLKRENSIKLEENNIIVTCGSTEAIFLALVSLIDPGDEVIIPDPGFLAYSPMVKLLNGVPVSLKLEQNREFQIDPELLRSLITKNTRVIIINTPSNPTGTVLDKKILREVADIALEHDIIVFSDEAYEYLVYGKAVHYSIGSFRSAKEEEKVITFQSFSKSFAMPGFRIGYAAGPKNIIGAMIKAHIYTSICAPTISQIAATEALSNSKEAKKAVKVMRDSYDRRRLMILRRLNEIEGFHTHKPEGAFYVFPSFDSKFKMDSFKFSEWLLKNAKVAVIPGTEFGKYGEGFVRMSYATSYRLVEEAMDRIERALKKTRK